MDKYFWVVCVICLASAVYVAVHTFVFLRQAAYLKGTVVGMDRTVVQSSDGSRQKSAPIVEYVTASGAKRTFAAKAAAFNCYAGDKVYVAYRDDKEKEVLLSLGELFLLPTVLLLFGVVLLYVLLPISLSSQIAYSLLRVIGR